MGHSWNCPTPAESRRKARDDAYFDFNYGHGREYRRGPYDCDESNRAYKREYEREAYVREEQAEDERRARRRADQRREEEEQQRAYWEQEERQREEDNARYEAEVELYWTTLEAAYIYQTGTP
jgi:hypothetical protein